MSTPIQGRGGGGERGGRGGSNNSASGGAGGNSKRRSRGGKGNRGSGSGNANKGGNEANSGDSGGKGKKNDPQPNKKNKNPSNCGNNSATTPAAGAAGGTNAAGEKKKRRNRNRKRDNKKKGNDEGGGEQQQQGQQQKQQPKSTKQNKQQRQKQKQPSQAKPKEPTEEELRILAEEKAKREQEIALEKERQRLAEIAAAKQRKKDELEAIVKDKIIHLKNFASKVAEHSESRSHMTPEAIGVFRKTFQETKKKNLKSDLKKCTAFCKKIKSTPNFDEQTVKSLLKDVDTLNLTRYLEEIANAFMECKIKVIDVNGVVKVCIALHERYKEFMEEILLPRILGIFKKNALDDTDPKYRRIYLRVLSEMLLYGVLPETKPVMKIVADAAGAPKDASVEKYSVTDANMLVSFAKVAGHELVGVMPKSITEDIKFLKDQEEAISHMEELEEGNNDTDCTESAEGVVEIGTEKNGSPDSPTTLTEAKVIDDDLIVISPDLKEKAMEAIRSIESITDARAVSDEVCQRFQKHLAGALQSLSIAYVSAHKKLSKMEKRCEQDRLLAGTLSDQREKNLEDARNLLESLRKSVETLAEVLNEGVPELVEEVDDTKINESTGLEVYKGEDGQDAELGPFDDEETRAFYCDVPDLLTTIPPALLGYTTEDIERMQQANAQKYGDNCDDVGESGDIAETAVEDDDESNDKGYEEPDANVEGGIDEGNNEEEKGQDKDTPHYKLMVLIEQELPECNRRDKVDELAEKFCTNHGASKNSRKRLEKALFMVPRSRLDLLPYYSRLAAIFDRVFTDIASPLVQELEQQFHGLARWKKQQNIDNRIRNAKFIGELTKFRVAPPIVALRGFERCLKDFSGYNVDIACCLLESCGRFLHKTKHTSAKLAQIMDTMVRIRKAKHFDERTVELMKSAFYMVKPPQMKVRERVKILPPIEAYLKDLLFVRLDQSNASFISKQILRLPWNDPIVDYGSLTVKYMLKACRKGRYKSVAAVASLVSTIKKSKPEILARIIDAVLEELQFVMEKPSIRDQQRAIVYAKLLGELHSHALVSSQAIFDQLFNFVNFDHDIPEALREASTHQPTDDSTTMPSSILKSSLGVSQVINEDEEMEEDEMKEDDGEEQKEGKKTLEPVSVSAFSKYDPRVPSSLDPPSAVFRIKLICTLLDSCVTSIVSTSNCPKLEKFLASFQRYLFIKDTLPTDIEFSLLDTFDLIASTLKVIKKDSRRIGSITIRYETWQEAHNTVITFEEAEALSDKKARNRLMAQAGVGNVSLEDDEEGDDMIEEDQVSLDPSLDDMSVNSMESDQSDVDGEVVSDEEMSEEEDAESDEESEDDEDEEDEDDDEDQVSGDEMYDEEVDEAAAHDAYMQKLENEAFDRELRMLTMEALDKGKHASRTAASAKVSDSMPSASQISRKRVNDRPLGNSTASVPFALSGAGGMNFQLIKRDHKGRLETKSLVVPSDTNLAKVATKQDTEAARERDILKARVLQYEAEIAEQAYSGDVYSTSEAVPENRNRRLLMEDIDRQFGNRPRSSYGGRGHRGGRGLKRF